ncbi:hypothetical protein [Chroococcidiopsis sp. CCMEE 29]|uniref:hypothetical protein n=1 Tax=Chroococcidiopsis sp. CCMEE 29 TaxID=155894 RepID=UPI00202060F1|nr:hypothetical protein [Chroococcidiopsis sp. CCMEE 29]
MLAQDDCQVGDAFTLASLEGEGRKYNRCWAIAKELTNSTVTVEVLDATITVKLENLNKINSADDERKLPQILKRIRRLPEVESLEQGAKVFLKDLSKRTNLTSLDEDLLFCLEKRYGVTE